MSVLTCVMSVCDVCLDECDVCLDMRYGYINDGLLSVIWRLPSFVCTSGQVGILFTLYGFASSHVLQVEEEVRAAKEEVQRLQQSLKEALRNGSEWESKLREKTADIEHQVVSCDCPCCECVFC